MRRTITVEKVDTANDQIPDYGADYDIKMRRAKWFDYTRRRFDIVPLANVADWCARQPNAIKIDEADRAEARRAILASIKAGEFGEGDWPELAFMPQVIPTYGLGSFPLRLSSGQIGWFTAQGHDMVPDLWAPRSLCRRWLDARGIAAPPWLLEATEPDLIEERQPYPHRTGAPGRPSSLHWAQQEMRRRFDNGEVNTHSIAAEARYLAEWVKTAHPDDPPIKAKTLQNQISAEYRRLSQLPEKK